MQLTPLRFLAASKHPKNMFETGKLVSVKENGRPIKPLVEIMGKLGVGEVDKLQKRSVRYASIF